MGQQIEIDKENQTVLLFSTKKQEWEDKTMSLSDINIPSYHGKVSGYKIQFNGADKKFPLALVYKGEKADNNIWR